MGPRDDAGDRAIPYMIKFEMVIYQRSQARWHVEINKGFQESPIII